MKNNEIYVLKDRGLLFINGEDSTSFLQNIVTNNINKVSEASSCFSALLTPQGKCLYEFIISKHKSGYFLDCEKENIEDLYRQLNLYKMRSKVEILNLSNEFVIAALSREKFLSLENSKDIAGNKVIKFEVDAFKKKCLIEGLDDIALSMEKISQIDNFEKKLIKDKPWLLKND